MINYLKQSLKLLARVKTSLLFGVCLFFAANAALAENPNETSSAINSNTTSQKFVKSFTATNENIFKLDIAENKNEIVFSWDIAPNHYLYKNKINVIDLKNNREITNTINFPKHIVFKDKSLDEEFDVYSNSLTLRLEKYEGLRKIEIKYQGCRKDGFCFAPLTKAYTIANLSSKPIKAIKPVSNTNSASQYTFSLNSIEEMFSNQTTVKISLAFLLLGLLLAFTPCVLPMIPIILSIIVGRTDLTSRFKTIALAFTYVLSMSLTYALVGVAAGALGHNIQITMQNPTVITAISIFIAFLSLYMMDIFKFNLPFNINKLIYKFEKQQGHGSFINAFILGILAALVITPCVTPALAGAITFIAKEGSILNGIIALFFMGLGIGAPLILFAIGGSFLLPKTGNWMAILKKLSGFMLLGLAVWLLDRVIEDKTSIIMWGSYFILFALFLTLITRSAANKIILAFSKILAIAAFIFGAILLTYSLGHQKLFSSFIPDIFKIKSSTIGETHKNRNISNLKWSLAKNGDSLDRLIAKSVSKNQKSFIFYAADWCTSCKLIKNKILTKENVVKILRNQNLIMVDATINSANVKEMFAKFKVYGVPTLIFLDENGNEIENLRLFGDVDENEILKSLKD